MRLAILRAGRLFLLLAIALPALARCCRRVSRTATGSFVGLANYVAYFSTPTLVALALEQRLGRGCCRP